MRPTQRTFSNIQQRKSDDAFRNRIIEEIIGKLTNNDARRLADLKVKLINKHTGLTHTDSFYCNGEIWSNIHINQKSLQKLPIHESLKEELHELLKDRKQFQEDKDKLRQGLAVIIRGLITNQDIRDALPEILYPFLDSTTGVLPRTRPELYTLQGKAIWLQQYEKTKDLIYFYLGSRLLS